MSIFCEKLESNYKRLAYFGCDRAVKDISNNVIYANTPLSNECEEDINADGYVNVTDVLELIDSWGTCWNSCDADLNNDNNVSTSDLLLLIEAWGTCP